MYKDMNTFIYFFIYLVLFVCSLGVLFQLYTLRHKDMIQKQRFDEMIENVYCINLSSNKERYLLANQMAKKTDIRLTRFEAVDTRGESFIRFKEFIDPDSLNHIKEGIMTKKRQRDSDLTPGAVGCYLSHMSLYREALLKGEKMILVFEDDVLIPKRFKQDLYQKLQNMPEGWDMLVLGWYGIKGSKNKKNMKQNIRISKDKVRLYNFILMHAYVITDVGMRKMLNYGTVPIRKQIDHMASDNSDAIHIYGVYPNTWIKQGNPKNDPIYNTSIQIPVAF